jgi:hypothetical protein
VYLLEVIVYKIEVNILSVYLLVGSIMILSHRFVSGNPHFVGLRVELSLLIEKSIEFVFFDVPNLGFLQSSHDFGRSQVPV